MKEKLQKLGQEAFPVLDFNQFCVRSNNFFAFFENDGRGNIYRQTNYYKKFEDENPAMVTDLRRKIAKRNRSMLISESLKPYLPDLYKAYKIMRLSGVSDEDLFT